MRQIEDLKRDWQSQPGISAEQFERIGNRVIQQFSGLQRRILQRDLVETIASFIVVALFAPGIVLSDNWVARLGFVIIVITGLTIPIILWQARRRRIATASADNFCSYLDSEIDFLKTQCRLLRLVLWCYLLPLFVGLLLLFIGSTDYSQISSVERTILNLVMLACSVVFILIGSVNHQVRKTRLEPWLEYYVEMRRSIHSGADFTQRYEDSLAVGREIDPARQLSRGGRLGWILLTVFSATLLAAAGVATMRYFDHRTGIFLASASPMLAILFIYMSGIWRRHPPA